MSSLASKIKLLILGSFAWGVVLEFSDALLMPPYGHPLAIFLAEAFTGAWRTFTVLLLPTIAFHFLQRAWYVGGLGRWRPFP